MECYSEDKHNGCTIFSKQRLPSHSVQCCVYFTGSLRELLLECCWTPAGVVSQAFIYLNDVATKRSPQALLFWIVELIIGKVPRILHFRLRHILLEEKETLQIYNKTIKNMIVLSVYSIECNHSVYIVS